MKNHQDRILNASIFQGVSKEDFPLMLETLDSQLKNYHQDQVIIKTGSPVKRAGLLLEGAVNVYREGFWNEPFLVDQITPGELFAISFASMKDGYANVTCITKAHSVILWFNLYEIFQMDDNRAYHTILVQNLMQILAQQTMATNEKLNHITQKSTRLKLMSYLSSEAARQNSATFDIPFDRQGLADYLGVERSAMSNELSKLKKDGYLIATKNHFQLIKK